MPLDKLEPAFSSNYAMTGLKNPNSVCYMNAVLQGLRSLTSLTEKLESKMNESKEQNGSVSKELDHLMKVLKAGKCKFVTATELKRKIGEVKL